MSFFEGLYDWHVKSGARMGDGFRISYNVKILGVETKIEMKVDEFIENKGWISNSTDGPKTRGEWRFAPNNGGTRFTYVLDYKMPMPGIGGILDKLLVRKTWVRLIDKSLENLKGALEV